MEQQIKKLNVQLRELEITIHGTLHEIDRLERELAPIEKKFNFLVKNKDFLKKYSSIVSIVTYANIKLELELLEMDFKKISNLLEKYKNYLDSLIIKENELLDEINLLNEKINKLKKVLKFDPNRKKNGQK